MNAKPAIVRRIRVWAPTPEGVDRLGRSARQLANNSAKQRSLPAVRRCLNKLKAVMAWERACKLKIADLVVELIDTHGLRQR